MMLGYQVVVLWNTDLEGPTGLLSAGLGLADLVGYDVLR
jgi:hypothetical protein